MYKQIKTNGWNIFISGTSEVYAHHSTNPEATWFDHSESKFVGRFKYARPGSSAVHFVKFLVKHFTPEQYFAAMEAGQSPLFILKTAGYLSYNELRCNGNARKSVAFATPTGAL